MRHVLTITKPISQNGVVVAEAFRGKRAFYHVLVYNLQNTRMLHNDWWSTLNLIEQVLWSFAIVCSLLSVIQAVLGLTGFDLYEDKNIADAHQESAVHFFSRSNALTFLTFSTWTAIIVLNLQGALFLALFVGVLVGLLIAGLISFLLYTEDKIVDLQETINHTAQVFRSIPPCKNGEGSIQVEIRGTKIELAAVTEGNALPEGAVVTVVEIIDKGTLVVQPVIESDETDLGRV